MDMKTVQPIDFAKYAEKEPPVEAQYVKRASDIAAGARSYLRNGIGMTGHTLPWLKTHDAFRLRGGEVTIWAGINGQGKSLVTGQIAYSLTKYSKVLIASMEMKPEITYARMCMQASGGSNPTDSYLDQLDSHFDENLYIFDKIGSINPTIIRNMIRYSALELGVKHIFIDSISKCGFDSNNNELSKTFMDMVTGLAIELNIHIHLIHHVKKSNSVSDHLDVFSVKGAGELTDLAFNVVLVYRNQDKIFAEKTGDWSKVEPDAPDSYLELVKQRNGDVTNKLWAFWFHGDSKQWLKHPTASPELFIQPWNK
jgi:twinkle protein